MAEEITVRDNDEFEQIIANHDIRVARALVETNLKNLKGRKRHLHALSVMVLNEATIYDITIDRKEFITTLEKNLPIYEKNELYEKCAEIVEAIKYIKKTWCIKDRIILILIWPVIILVFLYNFFKEFFK